MPITEIAPPIARPRHSAPTAGWIAASGESRKAGSRKAKRTLSTPGTWISPAKRAPKPSTAIATAIGHDCSAMWWWAPGKPTSVSSSSSFAGLIGGPWKSSPVSIRCWASSLGRPGSTRKIRRKV